MERLTSVRPAFGALMANWKMRAGATLAVLFALGSVLYMANTAIDSATSIWSKAELLYSFAATPWIGVMCLVAVVVLLTWGTKDVIAAQARMADSLAKADDRRADSERSAQEAHDYEILTARKAAHRLPLLLAKLDLWHKEIASFNVFILDFQGRLEAYKKDISKWQNEDGFPIDSSTRPMPPEMAFAAHLPQTVSFRAPDLPADWKSSAIKITATGGPIVYNKVFSQNENPLLPAVLAHNVQIATDYAQQLLKIAEQQRQEMPRLLHEIKQELARYE